MPMPSRFDEERRADGDLYFFIYLFYFNM